MNRTVSKCRNTTDALRGDRLAGRAAERFNRGETQPLGPRAWYPS